MGKSISFHRIINEEEEQINMVSAFMTLLYEYVLRGSIGETIFYLSLLSLFFPVYKQFLRCSNLLRKHRNNNKLIHISKTTTQRT